MSDDCFADYIQNHIGVTPVHINRNGLAYCEVPPCEELRPFVANYWAVTPVHNAPLFQEPLSMRVLPDGCVDLIFILDNQPDACWQQAEDRAIIGLRKKSLTKVFGAEANRIGVRFLPGGAFPFLHCPTNTLLGKIQPLRFVWGGVVKRIEEQLLTALPLAQKINIVEQALLTVIRETEPSNQLVMEVVKRIHQENGSALIEELALGAGTSTRNLNRLFIKWVGMNPKTMCRIARFRHALSFFTNQEGVSFSELALRCGYYDQSHFWNEFKFFYGLTPYQARRKMQSLLVSGMLTAGGQAG